MSHFHSPIETNIITCHLFASFFYFCFHYNKGKGNMLESQTNTKTKLARLMLFAPANNTICRKTL